MNRSKSDTKRRGYHHGHLREALIAAALELIGEKGPAGFTIAEAARVAGVSPAAPYRHFRDRDALLADVALRGFEQFGDDLARAWDNGQPHPYRALENLARAYLTFSRAQPAYYAAMFECQLPPGASREFTLAADRSFGILRQACEALCALMPADKRPPAAMMSLHIWSLTHGIASLFARGDGARRKLPMTPEDLLEAGLMLYLRGLGLEGL